MSELLATDDFRALMAVVEEGRRDDPTGALPWAALEELSKLVRCDAVIFTGADRLQRRCLIQQQIEHGEEYLLEFDKYYPETEPYWRLYPSFRKFQYLERTSDFYSVLQWSDFYTSSELRRAPLFSEYFAPNGVLHSISMNFRTRCWRRRSLELSLYRDSGPDFTERDRLALQVLRPHMYELYLASRRRPLRTSGLTRREQEVLHLVGEGCTNAEIAGQLVVSVATVRKHMEHIFDHLGVRTRTAAAAMLRTEQNTLDLG